MAAGDPEAATRPEAPAGAAQNAELAEATTELQQRTAVATAEAAENLDEVRADAAVGQAEDVADARAVIDAQPGPPRVEGERQGPARTRAGRREAVVPNPVSDAVAAVREVPVDQAEVEAVGPETAAAFAGMRTASARSEAARGALASIDTEPVAPEGPEAPVAPAAAATEGVEAPAEAARPERPAGRREAPVSAEMADLLARTNAAETAAGRRAVALPPGDRPLTPAQLGALGRGVGSDADLALVRTELGRRGGILTRFDQATRRHVPLAEAERDQIVSDVFQRAQDRLHPPAGQVAPARRRGRVEPNDMSEDGTDHPRPDRVDGPVLSGLDPIEAAQEAGRQRARPIGEPLNPPSPEAPPAAQDAQPPVTGPEALAADERLGTAPEIAAIEERLRQRERQALVQMLGLRDERELGFVRDRNRAHQMALESDAGARALLALDTSYDRALRTEPDEMVRSNLRQLQTEARAAVRQRHIQAAQEQARQIAETIAQASEAAFEAQDHARRGERWTHSVTSLSPRAEQEAAVLRSTLGLEPLPFLEEKQGGLLHILAKNRGPKVIESYFRVPGQDHMMVLERRLRNGGALLSQTVVTTERPLRERMVGMPGIRERELTYLPPRGTSATIEQIRAQDRTNLSPRTSGRKPRVRLRNYVSGPFTPGLIEGIYTDYGRAAGVPRNRLDGQLNTLRYGAGRRGGFWYWLTGGRF